jgi:serine protease Do
VNLRPLAPRAWLAFAIACMLAGCAAWQPAPRAPAVASAAAPGPADFAEAVNRGVHAAVGIYGVGKKLDLADADLVSRPAIGMAPEQLQPDPGTSDPASIGSGFFVDDQGHVVTAAHVVTSVQSIVVKLADQRVLAAQLVGVDEDADIALLKVALAEPIVPRFGSSLSLSPGDWVLALGEPYGLERTVVAGIVGGARRHFIEDSDVLFIQADLALNPGNSGGPLLDTSGAIVGMNSRIVVGGIGAPGVALAIPIEIVLQLAAELRSGGGRQRPRLGAAFEDVPPQLALAAGRHYSSGALVKAVSPGSLAERLGLKVGDIVVGMNRLPVGDSAELVRLLLAWRRVPGTVVTVYREGGYRQLAWPGSPH